MRSGRISEWLSNSASFAAMGACLGASMAIVTPAAAQERQASNQVETVVVTAERRSTNVQTTPISVSVLTAADLEKKSVLTLEQLMFATPALTINNFGQGQEFNIRGLGKGENNVQTPSGVVTYIDGVPIAGGFFQDFPFNDTASIEVLRGPQGTFAGENATGGAIFITSNNPSFDSYSGYGVGQVGNYGDVKLDGAINVPITDDFAMRISGLGERRDSFWSVGGPHTGDPGSLRQATAQVSFLWEPDAHFEALWKSYYAYIGRGGFPADPATLGCFGAVPNVQCIPNKADPFTVTNDVHNQGLEYGYRTMLQLQYTFGSGIVVRSITGEAWGGGSETYDLDGTDLLQGYLFKDHGEEKIFSEELNLLSPDTGPFKWIVGAFFQHDHVDLPGPGHVGFDIGIPQSAADIYLEYHTPKQHEAVFGQLTYDITPALEVQVGARYNHSTFDLNDKETLVGFAPVPLIYTVPCQPIDNFGCSNISHQSDSRLTGKIDVNYRVDDENYLYAFVATGHKDGALNTTPSIGGPNNPPAVIIPENVTDYESGWKSTLLGGHLQTTLDGFYNDYKNFQVSIATGPGQTGILNAPTAKDWGIELQGQAAFEALSFDFSGAYVHGDYGHFFAVDSRFATPAGTCYPSGGNDPSCENLTGHQMVFAPHWTFNAGVQYAFPVWNGDTLTPRIDYAFVDRQWTSVFQVPGLDQLGERNIVNAQLTYDMQNNWEFAAYATNLFNQHYIAAFSAGLGNIPGLSSSNLRNAGPPRQYGIRVSKYF